MDAIFEGAESACAFGLCFCTSIKTLLKVCSRTEYADRCSFDTHFYISSAPLNVERIAGAARGHWGIESMHWLLDVEFKDDKSLPCRPRRQKHGCPPALRTQSPACQ